MKSKRILLNPGSIFKRSLLVNIERKSYACCFSFICISNKVLLDFLFLFSSLEFSLFAQKVNLLITDNHFSTGMRFYNFYIAIAMEKCTKCLFLIRIKILLHYFVLKRVDRFFNSKILLYKKSIFHMTHCWYGCVEVVLYTQSSFDVK